MKMKKSLALWQDKLASHASIILLVLLTASLTTLAMLMTWSYLQVKDQAALIKTGVEFQAGLQQTTALEEARLPGVLAELAQDASAFDRSSQKVLDSHPQYTRLELRDTHGALIGSKVASTSTEKWAPGSRQQVPPGLENSFSKAMKEQKIYWAQSFAPSGETALEAIVPSHKLDHVLLVRFHPSHWLHNPTEQKLPPNVRVSFSALPLPALPTSDSENTATFSAPVLLRGLNPSLEFNYKSQKSFGLDPASLLVLASGLSLIVLLVSFNASVKRARKTQEVYAKQVLSLAKNSQLSTLGEISTALAHELNQPLSTITNHIATCEIRLKQLGYQDKTLDQSLKSARAQALRAGEVVQSIRLFLRRGPAQRATIDYEETIAEIMPIIGAIVKEAKASMDVISEPGLCARIDPSLFEQIVINLCKNALDAMDHIPTSERKLVVHSHSFDDPKGMQWARVDVIDKGHGVKHEDADKLFDSFFTTKNNGMGVGLNLCRSIAESYEGHILWRNNEGGGATFTLELPKHAPATSNSTTTAT